MFVLLGDAAVVLDVGDRWENTGAVEAQGGMTRRGGMWGKVPKEEENNEDRKEFLSLLQM